MNRTQRDAHVEEVRGMKADGKTYAAIGAVFNVSRQRIQQIMKPRLEILDQVIIRSRGCCEQCGQSLTLAHFHHRSFEKDVFNTAASLERLCVACHKKKHAQPLVERYCEKCSNRFSVLFVRRKQRFCSRSCVNVRRGNKPRIFLEHDGKRLSFREWSVVTGIRLETLQQRYWQKWDTETILTSPLGRKCHIRKPRTHKPFCKNGHPRNAPGNVSSCGHCKLCWRIQARKRYWKNAEKLKAQPPLRFQEGFGRCVGIARRAPRRNVA